MFATGPRALQTCASDRCDHEPANPRRDPPDGAAESLLALDPDLADALPPPARTQLARFSVEVVRVPPGAWRPAVALARRAELGALVVEGLLVRTLTVGGRRTAELTGAGDIVLPWEDNDLIPPSVTAAWRALEPTRLAVLDDRVGQLGSAHPSLIEAIVGRCVRRARMLSFQQLVASCPSAEQRLLMMFGVLARRWGRVRADDVHLPLQLTHQTLADLIGTRRPSVTTGLGTLAARCLVTRVPGGWSIAMSVLDEDLPPDLASGR